MKKIYGLIGFLLLSLFSFAQQSGSLYVAAKSGLSIRENPDAGARVLDKVPYGTKITILETEEEKKSLIAEGMRGYWQKIKYNNKTGFILDSYLLPWPPPKVSSVKEMKQYFAQVTTTLGARLSLKSGTMNHIADAGWELQKQFYKNGAEWHHFMGYEYGSETYILPGFTMEQGFLLLRLIPEFKNAFGEKDEFPSENKTFKKGEDEYSLKVDKTVFSPEYVFTNKITLEYTDEISFVFEMFMMGNQLVIVFGSGV